MNLAHALIAGLSVASLNAVGAARVDAQHPDASVGNRGFSAKDVKRYPASNWTSYTLKSRGQAVRYDGGVSDATGFVLRMSIDYGNGAQVHVERPEPTLLGLTGPPTMLSTSEVTMSASEAAKDFIEILNDEGEQKRAQEDLKRMIASKRGEQFAESVARKVAGSMQAFAAELRDQ